MPGLYDRPVEDDVSALTKCADMARKWMSDLLARAPRGFVVQGAETAQHLREEAVQKAFIQNLSIERPTDTYVIDVSYISPDREQAAEYVNAMVSA